MSLLMNLQIFHFVSVLSQVLLQGNFSLFYYRGYIPSIFSIKHAGTTIRNTHLKKTVCLKYLLIAKCSQNFIALHSFLLSIVEVIIRQAISTSYPTLVTLVNTWQGFRINIPREQVCSNVLPPRTYQLYSCPLRNPTVITVSTRRATRSSRNRK